MDNDTIYSDREAWEEGIMLNEMSIRHPGGDAKLAVRVWSPKDRSELEIEIWESSAYGCCGPG